MSIDVEEEPRVGPKSGLCVMAAWVGPTNDVFEIYQVEDNRNWKSYTYYVNHVLVPEQVYRDCLATAAVDRFEFPEETAEGDLS